MEDDLKAELAAAEAELSRHEAEGDEEAVLRAQNRIDGLRNAEKQPAKKAAKK